MKILLISNYCEGVGGISVQVKSLRDHLRGEGFFADIFSTKGSVFFRIKAFFRLLSSGRTYDVFHVHACSDRGFLPAVFGITAGRILHKRVVLTYHGGGAEEFFRKHTKLVRHYLHRTDANIVLSGFLGQILETYGIPYKIIPNIIEFDGSQFRRRSLIEPKFICIRSHTKTYNIECILDAFSSVKKQYPSATLTLLGGGPLHEALKIYSRNKHIDDVDFVGQIDNSHIYDYLDKADIMLSSPIIDNMPVSLLEGFNAGLLVISSNVGGVPYMVEDGRNGLLFQSGNASDLANKMIYALTQQAVVQQLIVSAYSSLETYSWKSIWPELQKIYSI